MTQSVKVAEGASVSDIMIDSIRKIAVRAGGEILKHYAGATEVESKADDSPLTQADLASHRLICEALAQLDPEIPILSEESDEAAAGRAEWRRFWLVDPLDGTKEFIKKSGQFTVNIALIDGGEAILGVIYVPAMKLMYYAQKGAGAFRQEDDGVARQIHVARPDAPRLRIVASRDHAGPQVRELFERFPEAETRSLGSSLKFCLVAEGQADIYLRDVPTMEWDTAAAQCIVETAGGEVRTLDGERLLYNKADLRNPPLITLGDPEFPWQ